VRPGGWRLQAGRRGRLVICAGPLPPDATVLPIATWPCALCGSEPVLRRGDVCWRCRQDWVPDGPHEPTGIDSLERWEGGDR